MGHTPIGYFYKNHNPLPFPETDMAHIEPLWTELPQQQTAISASLLTVNHLWRTAVVPPPALSPSLTGPLTVVSPPSFASATCVILWRQKEGLLICLLQMILLVLLVWLLYWVQGLNLLHFLNPVHFDMNSRRPMQSVTIRSAGTRIGWRNTLELQC